MEQKITRTRRRWYSEWELQNLKDIFFRLGFFLWMIMLWLAYCCYYVSVVMLVRLVLHVAFKLGLWHVFCFFLGATFLWYHISSFFNYLMNWIINLSKKKKKSSQHKHELKKEISWLIYNQLGYSIRASKKKKKTRLFHSDITLIPIFIFFLL